MRVFTRFFKDAQSIPNMPIIMTHSINRRPIVFSSCRDFEARHSLKWRALPRSNTFAQSREKESGAFHTFDLRFGVFGRQGCNGTGFSMHFLYAYAFDDGQKTRFVSGMIDQFFAGKGKRVIPFRGRSGKDLKNCRRRFQRPNRRIARRADLSPRPVAIVGRSRQCRLAASRWAYRWLR